MAPSAPGFSAMGALSAQGKGGAPGLNAWQERAATLTALRGGGGAEGAAAIASAGPGNSLPLGAFAGHCWVPGSKSGACADHEVAEVFPWAHVVLGEDEGADSEIETEADVEAEARRLFRARGMVDTPHLRELSATLGPAALPPGTVSLAGLRGVSDKIDGLLRAAVKAGPRVAVEVQYVPPPGAAPHPRSVEVIGSWSDWLQRHSLCPPRDGDHSSGWTAKLLLPPCAPPPRPAAPPRRPPRRFVPRAQRRRDAPAPRPRRAEAGRVGAGGVTCSSSARTARGSSQPRAPTAPSATGAASRTTSRSSGRPSLAQARS